jgi:hypothetical protein
MTPSTANRKKSLVRSNLIEKPRKDDDQGHASIRAKLGQVVPIPHTGWLPDQEPCVK